MTSCALAVTIHDPEERLLSFFDPALSELSGLYGHKVAACSGATSPRTVRALQETGFQVIRSGNAGIGESRRMAVSAALQDNSATWIHYADLDRLVHWQRTFPAELRETLAQSPTSDYIALGRTPRAFQTHPPVQILAETLTNEAFSSIVGSRTSVDLVAGSCLFSRAAGEIIAVLSTEPTNATDLEWPALIMREMGAMPEFRQLEGLEFETADCYGEEIAQAGSLDAWISSVYERPSAWVARATLAQDSIAALARVLPESWKAVRNSRRGQPEVTKTTS